MPRLSLSWPEATTASSAEAVHDWQATAVETTGFWRSGGTSCTCTASRSAEADAHESPSVLPPPSLPVPRYAADCASGRAVRQPVPHLQQALPEAGSEDGE